MNEIKFSCCIKADNFTKAEAYGYDYFEISGKELYEMADREYDSLKKMVENSSLKCCGCNAYCPPGVKIAGPGFDKRKAREYAERVIGRAAGLGAVNMGIGSPLSRMLPQDYSYEQARYEMECFLVVTAEVALKYGAEVLLEALNPSECNFVTSNIEALNLVEAIHRRNIGIVYDIFHALMSKEDPDVFKKILPCVRHVHVCGISETSRRFPASDDMDKIRPYINVIKNSGYKGIISVEAGYKAFESAEEALLLLKGEWYEN